MRVPKTVAPGVYTVRVQAGDAEVALADGLIVNHPRDDEACTGKFTSNTRVSLARGTIAIDRFHNDGTRETIDVAVADVTAEWRARLDCGAP